MLLDRDVQLGAIEAGLVDAIKGEGQILLIRAGPGLGKTTLLDWARTRALGRGLRALTARGAELEHDLPFGIIRQLFESPLRALAPAQRRELMSGGARRCGPLLGFAPDRVRAPDQPEVIHALYWLLTNFARRTPLLLAIDDLHWGDLESLRWLSYLAGRVAELPVVVACAARSGEGEGEAQARLEALAEDGASVLKPMPLGLDAVSRLVAERLGHERDEEFVRACRQTTGGNPFLITEVLRAASQEGIAPRAASATRIRGLSPKDVERSIVRRLARLGPPAERLAAAVAVLGPDTELQHAAALSDMPVASALKTWDALARAEILRPRPASRVRAPSDSFGRLRDTGHRRAQPRTSSCR